MRKKENYQKSKEMSDEEYENIVKEINPHITLLSKFNSVKSKVRYICNNHDVPYYGKASKMSLLKPYKCPWCKCGHENIVIGKNDIKSQNPVMYEMLVDKSINDKCNVNSDTKTDFRCLYCGSLMKNKIINHVHTRGLKCKCMDGDSQGEKFFNAVIRQVDDNIKDEFHLNNNNSFRYDFGGCVNGVNWICEINGKQHYEKTFETCGGRTLEEEQENDRLKKEYALNNGIDMYVEISSKNNGFLEMKKEIVNSELSNLYDFSKVDFVDAYRRSLKSEIIDVCQLWNEGYKVMQIAAMTNHAKGTVRTYLTKGNEIGLCTYDHTKSNKTAVICLNTGEIFESQRDAERKYDLKRGYLFNYLSGKSTMYVDNVEYKWDYYNEE